MSEKKKTEQKKIRLEFLRGQLAQNAGHWLQVDELIKAVLKRVSELPLGELSPRTCRRDLDEIEGELLGKHGEYKVRRERNKIGSFKIDTSPEIDAEEDYKDIKRNLARLLWEETLDVVVSKEEPLPVQPREWPAWLDAKIGALRTHTHVSILLDAGSTTRACARLLLHAPDMPLNSRPAPADTAGGRAKFQRLVVPTLVTNSLTIADEVRKSPYKQLVRLRMIGGELRLDRSSFIGPYAELCAAAYKMRVDLVALGCTGCRTHDSGLLAFGVEDINESRTKGACLEMGLGGLRVVLCDSSKFKNTSVAHVFAPLSPHSIDLVVTDDGFKTGAEEKVKEFLNCARQAQVPVLVLRTAPATDPVSDAPAPDTGKADPADAATTSAPSANASSEAQPTPPPKAAVSSTKRRKKK